MQLNTTNGEVLNYLKFKIPNDKPVDGELNLFFERDKNGKPYYFVAFTISKLFFMKIDIEE